MKESSSDSNLSEDLSSSGAEDKGGHINVIFDSIERKKKSSSCDGEDVKW